MAIALGMMVLGQGAGPRGLALLLLAVRLWVIAVLAEGLLVMPLMLAAPRARTPPVWLAALWGAGAAFAVAVLLAGAGNVSGASGGGLLGLGLTGALSGSAYAVGVRRSSHQPAS